MTRALIPVSRRCFEEVRQMLEAAEYTHDGKHLGLEGLALVVDDGRMFNIMRNRGLKLVLPLDADTWAAAIEACAAAADAGGAAAAARDIRALPFPGNESAADVFPENHATDAARRDADKQRYRGQGGSLGS